MMRGREWGSVVSFRLPLVICKPRWFVWTVPNSQIRRQIDNPNPRVGSTLKETLVAMDVRRRAISSISVIM
jgi:hypothetical protein